MNRTTEDHLLEGVRIFLFISMSRAALFLSSHLFNTIVGLFPGGVYLSKPQYDHKPLSFTEVMDVSIFTASVV
jgi:hypothetical protein